MHHMIESTKTQRPRQPARSLAMLLRGASRTVFLLLGVFACGAGPALADGYWTLTKSLPATIKFPDPNESIVEQPDGTITNTFKGDKPGDVWQTRTAYSPPPSVLVPLQHVRFGSNQVVIQNGYGHNDGFYGTHLYYYYGVSKDPSAGGQIIDTNIGTKDTVTSRQASGVLTVPQQGAPGSSLWLNVSTEIIQTQYNKYFQYSWNPGPVPANVAQGDVTVPVTPVTPTNPSSPTNQGANTPSPSNPVCPENPSVLELQICHIEAKAGATIQVPVYLLKSASLGNLNLEIRYNAAVAKASGKATQGSLIKKSQVIFDSNLNQLGLVRIGFASSAPITGSGILAYVPFSIVGAPGSKTALDIKDTAANTTTNARPSFVLRSGEIVVAAATPTTPPQPPPPPPPTTFTALDALKALQMSLGLLPPDMKYDLDKTGQITSNDARLILLRVVGK